MLSYKIIGEYYSRNITLVKWNMKQLKFTICGFAPTLNVAAGTADECAKTLKRWLE
jgi:hypothetical protein